MVTWTYNVFDKVKVVIMGNGYNVFGNVALDAFLLAHNEYINANSRVQATNLRNIVQYPGERVAILTRSPKRIFHQFILKDHVLSERLGLVSQVCHRLCGCQDHQGSAAARSGLIRKRTRFARKPLIKTQ